MDKEEVTVKTKIVDIGVAIGDIRLYLKVLYNFAEQFYQKIPNYVLDECK